MNHKQIKSNARLRRPVKIEGVYHHGPLCECSWCRDPVKPKYVRLGGR